MTCSHLLKKKCPLSPSPNFALYLKSYQANDPAGQVFRNKFESHKVFATQLKSMLVNDFTDRKLTIDLPRVIFISDSGLQAYKQL